MYVKVMAITAASIALAACSGRMPETDGYLYPNFFGAPVTVAHASATVSAEQDLGAIARSPDDTAIFRHPCRYSVLTGDLDFSARRT